MLPEEYRPCQGKVWPAKGLKGKDIAKQGKPGKEAILRTEGNTRLWDLEGSALHDPHHHMTQNLSFYRRWFLSSSGLRVCRLYELFNLSFEFIQNVVGGLTQNILDIPMLGLLYAS
jgi:hypothetical protein